jgi:Delta3-Delta2-enoyl-CoA isomerase
VPRKDTTVLESIRHDATLELKLARPPVNALDPKLVAALRDAIVKAPASGARALVLSGQPGMYSAGLDVPSLLALDRAGLIAFWGEFFGLVRAIARSPIPIVAAITGHSPAGGAVLAIFCDYRVMARGPYRIGLNEVQVGLAVPEPIQVGLRRLVGAYRAERLMVAGAMVDAEEALRVGFVDELVEPDAVVARAHAWCAAHLALPHEAMSATRRAARADLHAALEHGDVGEAFADFWFADEAQSTLRALVAKLKARSAA